MGLKEIEMAHRTEESLISLLRDLMKIFHPENKNWMTGKPNNQHTFKAFGHKNYNVQTK